jgi:transcriptional regulatory protein LEU3
LGEAYSVKPIQELPNPALGAQNPVAKFDPSLINPHLQDPPVMGFDAWDGSEYSVPPMLDQFPDYDWAAGFNFSNSEHPTIPISAMNPIMPGNAQNMGYTFG